MIIGPIGDFGGRQLEVGLIAESLKDNAEVMICSTGNLTNDSQIFDYVNFNQVVTLNKLVYNNNLAVRVSTRISWLRNKRKLPISFYVPNKLNKKLFNLDRKIKCQIEFCVKKVDIVIICAQLTSNHINTIILSAYEFNIPVFFRTTGTIKKICENQYGYLEKISKFIHHSEINATNLNVQLKLPYVVIDQCAINERKLLDLKIKVSNPLKYGFLGRFSKEKGLLELIDFFCETNYPFYLAGDGPLKNSVLDKIKNNENCNYVGLVSADRVHTFFKQIDVLIISSHEESGPLVGLEAMAAGKVIISTKVGAMEERLRHKESFWFDIDDFQTLSFCIEKLRQMEENELLRIMEGMRDTYIEKYRQEILMEKYRLLV